MLEIEPGTKRSENTDLTNRDDEVDGTAEVDLLEVDAHGLQDHLRRLNFTTHSYELCVE